MRLSTQDRFATTLVGVAVILALGWLVPVPGAREIDVRAVTVGVLALGMVASAAAVVPGFGGLIHGSKLYLLGASVLGLVALAAAIMTVANGTESTLAALVIVMVVLWVAATVRHGGGVGALAPRSHG
jgi:hypothetical protein